MRSTPGVARGLAEVHGRLAVAPGEVVVRAGAAAHRVDQVVGGAAAFERLAQAAAADGVAAADLDGGRLARARGVAGERAHGAAALEELVDQEAADVAGGAGDERGIWFAVWGHCARYVAKQARDSICVAVRPVDGACRGRKPWTCCRRKIEHAVKGLAIKDVAERTGIAAATIRMWEQRYGFPEPARTDSGYRVYTDADVDALRRVSSLREDGLSVPAALERARAAAGSTDRPSIYGAIAGGDDPVPAQRLRKRTLTAISRAIEDETLARAAGPVVIGAFQSVRNFEAVEHRYARLARAADACIVFADFASVRERPGRPTEIPIAPEDALGNEWAVVVDAPGYAACLLAWETPESQRDDHLPDRDRRFEALWTLDPRIVRRAALVGAGLAARGGAELGERLEAMLRDRPLAFEAPAPGLTSLTNRIVGYLD